MINIAKSFLDGDERPERFLRWCFGGGPSNAQKQGQQQVLQNAQNEGAEAGTAQGDFNSAIGKASPFYASEATNGLPFYNNLTDFSSGTAAQAYAPAKAAFLRQSSTMGALPSGSKAAGMADINEAQGKTFDNSLVSNMFANQQAKQQGAAGLMGVAQTTNPAAFYGGSTGAGAAGMNPLQPQPNPWAGIAGGAVQGAASALPILAF
jgi:hypothetical protein